MAFRLSVTNLSPSLLSLSLSLSLIQDLYGVRSDLGNLFKALGRLEDAKVSVRGY